MHVALLRFPFCELTSCIGRLTWPERVSLANGYLTLVRLSHVEVALSAERFLTADGMLESPLNMPLRGIAIGNGWIDSKEQYLAYLDFSVKSGLIEEKSHVWSLATYSPKFEAHVI